MAKEKSTASPRLQPSKICQQRRIKVNTTHYPYQTQKPPIQTNYRPVPWIQMKGNWLHNAGFTINTPVNIKVRHGCLVLTVDTGD